MGYLDLRSTNPKYRQEPPAEAGVDLPVLLNWIGDTRDGPTLNPIRDEVGGKRDLSIWILP